MNQLLSHLPTEKQEELERITKLILKSAKVEMIWLFGSYATGKWVENVTYENGTRLEYKSDYDILVILPFDDVKKHYKIRNAIKSKLEDKGLLNTQVSIIYHSLKDVHLALINGSYFFVNLFKEGIELANVSKHQLAEPKILSPEERKNKAQSHFDQWFESAGLFYENFEFNFSKAVNEDKYLNISAFQLHQATERFFHCVLLVFNDYKPKQHDLDLLNIADQVKVLKELTEEICNWKIGRIGYDQKYYGTPKCFYNNRKINDVWEEDFLAKIIDEMIKEIPSTEKQIIALLESNALGKNGSYYFYYVIPQSILNTYDIEIVLDTFKESSKEHLISLGLAKYLFHGDKNVTLRTHGHLIDDEIIEYITKAFDKTHDWNGILNVKDFVKKRAN